jgi:hypothetical protein
MTALWAQLEAKAKAVKDRRIAALFEHQHLF